MGISQSQEKAWEQLSREIGAQFIKGELGKADKIVAMEKEWTITLTAPTKLDFVTAGSFGIWIPISNYKDTTYMSAPYLSKDGFVFEVCWERARLGKLSGIWGNNESKVQALFANPKIRQLIVDLSPIGFGTSVQGHGLQYQMSGLVTDIKRLKTLFELFAETLNQLCSIGSAREEKPHIYDVPGGVRHGSRCPRCNSEYFTPLGLIYQCAACDAWFQ